ncbi:hypothetical protein UFOVP950_17 [uncultured Caudovirales phage]|uniref:Uncharacterized protein n=1 Tax=uncultured Caudovirales phage TaxID=2100421 RepID=A0A6J5PP23_9CAUD|nr:hypothetical protein UFOVP950_17 [uncultured Caudovirales phage]
MRYLALILLLSSCSTTEIEQVNKYDTLLLKIEKSQKVMDSSIVEATKKEARLIDKTVKQIIQDKKQIAELVTQVAEAKANPKVEIQIQTIRDTVFVTEKKNFWGKSKKDTL